MVGATHSGAEKENQVPPMFLAGLISKASKLRKKQQKLGRHQTEDRNYQPMWIRWAGRMYKSSRTKMAKMNLEGQLDVVDYRRITVPESVHMGDPAGGYVEILKVRTSPFDGMA